MSLESALGDLANQVGAVAVGLWRRGGDHLVQVCFVSDPDLPEPVGVAFALATRIVPLTNGELGIVKAAMLGEVAFSRAVDLPPDSGSGYWLRQFGASCSVAVPVGDQVLSVALAETPDDLNDLILRLREHLHV